jgi:hypothetical protein
MNNVNLIDPTYEIVGDFEAIKRTQEIPEDFLTGTKEQRDASSAPAGDFHKVASIPVAVVEQWMREGFDVMKDRNITVKDIVARLKKENLTAFLTTNKRL